MSKYIKVEDIKEAFTENIIVSSRETAEEIVRVISAIKHRIIDLPIIEIVRCKDCKRYKDFDGCFFSTAECEPEHFCSWGERQSADETLREICRDFIGIVEETRKDND